METREARQTMDETGDIRAGRREWDSSARLRCWQPGEVEVEDRWGIGSMSPRSESSVPHDQFQVLKKSASRQHLQGSRRLQQAGHRMFSCFRHSTINLTVRDMASSTPPKGGHGSAAHGVTFMDHALDHHHTDTAQDLHSVVEPTSPVVNCMGQVRSNKTQKHGKTKKETTEAGKDMAIAMDMDMDRLRRTKSQAARNGASSPPPPGVSRSKSCKWKQLLLPRSNSSSISPSSFCHDPPQTPIDLCRFSSACASSEPFYHQRDPAAPRKPDKTCLFMQSQKQWAKTSAKTSSKTGSDTGFSQKPAEGGEPGSTGGELGSTEAKHVSTGAEHGSIGAEPELVVRILPKLKTKRTESPKWLADEPALQRRQPGLFVYNKASLKKSSETSTSHA